MTKQTDLNLKEVCQELGKSIRTVSRYIKAGRLNPKKIKTEKGIEYRFNLAELESLKKRIEKAEIQNKVTKISTKQKGGKKDEENN